MTTRRAKAHRFIVLYEKNAKRSLRATALIECLIYLGRAAEARFEYINQWKKEKESKGEQR